MQTADSFQQQWTETFAEHRPWAEDLDVLFFAMVHARLRPDRATAAGAVYGLDDAEKASTVYTLACRAAGPVARWLHRRTVDRWNRATDELYRQVHDPRIAEAA